MLTAHAIWAGNRQPPHRQSSGTLKDDADFLMFTSKVLYSAYQVMGAR